MKISEHVADADTLRPFIIEGMQDKKAQAITIVNLKNIQNAVTDYFIICSGTSDKHIDAIAEAVEAKVKTATKTKPQHVEGSDHQGWLLLDYIDVVVHIFEEEKRSFYALEDLWGDAEVSRLEDPA